MSGQRVSRPPAPPRPPANPPTRQPAANPPTPVLFAYITGIKPVILIHRPPFRHTRALRSTAVAPGTANTPIHPALPRTGGWNPPRSPPAHRQYPVPRRLQISLMPQVRTTVVPLPPARAGGNTAAAPPGRALGAVMTSYPPICGSAGRAPPHKAGCAPPSARLGSQPQGQ